MFPAEPPRCCASAEFGATFARLDPVSMVMSLKGEVDIDNAGHVAHLVSWVLQSGAVIRLVIDLGGVGFFGYSGIRALIDAHAWAAASGCRLVLTRPKPVVHRMLDIAGLLEIFELPAALPADGPDIAADPGRSSIGCRLRSPADLSIPP
jgi:anti-sigma B factor antagonist